MNTLFPSRGLRWFALLSTLVLLLVTLTAGPTRLPAHERSDRFWSALSFQTASSVAFESLADMRAYADAVVVGRIASVELGRIFGELEQGAPDPEEGRVHYITAHIDVDRLLKGQLVPGSERRLKLELPMPTKEAFAELSLNVPSERAIYFLFSAGESAAEQRLPPERQKADREYYALIAVGAHLREVDGRAHGAGNPDLGFLLEFEAMRFDTLVERVATSP